MRGFMWLTRPLIVILNRAANWCLVKVGVQPVDQVASGQDPEALRHLVEHSATVGTLDERYHGHLTSALELESLTVGDIVRPNDRRAVSTRMRPSNGSARPPMPVGTCACWSAAAPTSWASCTSATAWARRPRPGPAI